MKVRELIEELEMLDGDREVMIVHQPSWPLAEYVGGVVDLADEDEDEYGDRLQDSDRDREVVWIVAGGQHYRQPYGPKEAFNRV